MAIELVKVGKSFGNVKALQSVSLRVSDASVHAILGENGAGKSTLMNVLFGLYQPDSGRVLIDGTPVALASPREAMKAGIGMVHQHFMLADNLSVAENVALSISVESLSLGLRDISRRIREVSDTYKLGIDPEAIISDIAIGTQQRVEILKALYNNAKGDRSILWGA